MEISAHLKRHRYLYILLAVIVAANYRLLWELTVDWWHDDNYSHGFLVLPLSIYFYYRRRAELHFPAETSKLGISIFVVGLLFLGAGSAAGEYFTSRFGFVLTVTGLVRYHIGTENFRSVWFSFFLLLFMIPIPATIYYSLTSPMQTFAASVTDSLLNFIGAPSIRQGNTIILDGYHLEVAEACSGLRSLVSLLTLAAIYGHLWLPGRMIPIIVFVAAIPIAIVTNIFRIFTTAIGAYAISPKLADSFLHELSGTIVFFVALVQIIIFSSGLKWIAKRFS